MITPDGDPELLSQYKRGMGFLSQSVLLCATLRQRRPELVDFAHTWVSLAQQAVMVYNESAKWV